MKYTVNIIDASGRTICYTPDCTQRQAITVACGDAATYPQPQYKVYISWYRKSDGQRGYLNPDGNHAITGSAW